jgi:hypothetical protein
MQRVFPSSLMRVRSTQLDPATFGPEAIVLIGRTNSVIKASLSLNLAGNEATLLPANPLGFSAPYRIVINPGLRDMAGGTLSGTNEFSFTTVGEPARAGSELIIYEPGATNIPPAILDRLIAYTPGEGSNQIVVHGGPGVAEGGAAVTLVNVTSGDDHRAGAPGRFVCRLARAEETDYVQAVIFNSNGTRTQIDATRQLLMTAASFAASAVC